MKTLYIVRHGEKNIIDETVDDYDIEVTKKGLKDIENQSIKLKEKGVIPDLIVSSPAIRTRQTADIISKELNYTKNIMYNEVLYQAFMNELVESITYTFDDVNTLIIVGHNPSLTALGVSFVGLKEKILMGEIVRIDFNCNSWTEIDKSNSKLIEHIKVD
ncbi:phosphoglycerate mutase [Halarcobacter mediterraneus]|uniref:Phosphoglycerate mutase n=1 Tax=Halarcobacter mediterraneus TaxID=2023153 RepID=A0A4Q1AXJ0_9BACT|nr:histidine phosphatase family protein [Halarcobacter mediterraneus]RXK13050.1 phosphoglycerate mutase [Halarcobacter mediterraneus]